MTAPTAKDACPHCGKSVGLTFWNLLPARENRGFSCKACGGHYDLANNSKMASMVGGMIGMLVAIGFPFQWIIKAGHGSKLYVAAGVAVTALSFGLVSIVAARLALKLEPKS
jgi:hypothetical protein